MNSIPSSDSRLNFFRSHIGKSTDSSRSPVARWLNGVLLVVEPDKMVGEFTVRADMTNPMGTLHGGVAAMIMDEMCGMLTFALGREYAFTSVNLNCDFLNPAVAGDVLIATSEIIRAGRNVVHCECRITGENGKLITKCASNLIQTSLKLSF